jgi:hypothetical protein
MLGSTELLVAKLEEMKSQDAKVDRKGSEKSVRMHLRNKVSAFVCLSGELEVQYLVHIAKLLRLTVEDVVMIMSSYTRRLR